MARGGADYFDYASIKIFGLKGVTSDGELLRHNTEAGFGGEFCFVAGVRPDMQPLGRIYCRSDTILGQRMAQDWHRYSNTAPRRHYPCFIYTAVMDSAGAAQTIRTLPPDAEADCWSL